MALSRLMMIGIAIAILAVFLVLVLYLYVSSVERSLVTQIVHQSVAPKGRISGSAFVNSTGVLSYNSSESYAEYAVLHYNYSNATSGNVSLQMYSSNPVRKIYLINVSYSCFKCLNEYSVYQSLGSWLGAYGLLFNSSSLSYVNLTSVPSLPGNSILIVPSGLMPSVLLPFSGSNPNLARTDIITLLARGDTIIYAGANFSKSIENGINYISSNQTLVALGAAKLNTTRLTTKFTSNGFYFDSPSYYLTNGSIYGPILYTHSGNGTLISFSNFPSAGWSNSSALAHDLALAIYDRFWMDLVAKSPVDNLTSFRGTTTLFTISPPIPASGDINALVNKSYSIVNLRIQNRSSFIVDEIPFNLRFENNGTLSLPGVIGEGQSIPISIYVGGTTNLRNVTIGNFSKNALLFHIEIFNSTLSYIYSLPVGFFNTSLSVVIYTSFAFKPGYYVASLRDINNKIYENALFYLPFFRITPISINFKNGTFLFNVINNNQSVSGISYTASLNGGYQETGTIQGGILNYTVPKGSVIPYGSQIISMKILGINYSMFTYYTKPVAQGIPPLYIEFGVAAIAIILLNLIAKAPTRDEYFIDVPLFPPTEKFEVRTPSTAVLSLFDTVNERFGWRYMPLTAEEMKLGISSNIRYNNMPIMITMENAAEILYKLANSGQVEVIPPYFMPKKWIEEAHHDMEYLVIFRKLRDFAVKNAILFTDLDSGGSADMIMTNRGTQIYIYIYSKASGIRNIKLGINSVTFVVFLDAESRAQFTDRLYTTYGEEAEKLRMGIANTSIIPIDTEKLDQLLY